MSELCKNCSGSLRGFGADHQRGLCLSCKSNGTYQQEEEKEQAQVKDHVQALRVPSTASPAPAGNSPAEWDEGAEPELRALLRAHEDGRLTPEPVGVGEMPPHAGRVMKSLSERMEFLVGLRLAVGDERPLPYAVSMAAEDAGVDIGTASKALNALVRAEVWDHVGSLPPTKPGLDGTKLYAPHVAAVVPLRRAA
jgi:hypothetical protein